MGRKKGVRDKYLEILQQIERGCLKDSDSDSGSSSDKVTLIQISMDERMGKIHELEVVGENISVVWYEGDQRRRDDLPQMIRKVKRTELMDCPYAAICDRTKDASRCFTGHYKECEDQKRFFREYGGRPPRIISILLQEE